jgi:hypothetical protein
MLNVCVKTDTELVTVVFGVENSMSNSFPDRVRLTYVARVSNGGSDSVSRTVCVVRLIYPMFVMKGDSK